MAILQPDRQQEQSPQQFMNEIAMAKMRNQKNEAYDLVRRYNQNPKSIKDEDIPRVLQSAEMFGWNITTGRQKDTAGWLEAVGAFVGGGVDAVLLDLLKDSWYSTRRTKDYKTAGKITGLVASLFTPASFGAGLSFARGMTVGQKALTGLKMAAKYLTAPGLTAGTKRMLGMALATRASALGVTKMGAMPARWAFATHGKTSAQAGLGLGKLLASGVGGKIPGAFSGVGKFLPYALPAYGGMRLLGTTFGATSKEPSPYEMAEMPRMPIAQP